MSFDERFRPTLSRGMLHDPIKAFLNRFQAIGVSLGLAQLSAFVSATRLFQLPRSVGLVSFPPNLGVICINFRSLSAGCVRLCNFKMAHQLQRNVVSVFPRFLLRREKHRVKRFQHPPRPGQAGSGRISLCRPSIVKWGTLWSLSSSYITTGPGTLFSAPSKTKTTSLHIVFADLLSP